MAGGKQSPRQKMINLMYLVFISMLAMNVDREVLRSFEGVNSSLELSTQLTKENNDTFYDNIKGKKEKGDVGYAEIYDKAESLRKQSDEVVSAIEEVKNDLKKQAEYSGSSKEGEEANYNSLQNTDVVNKVIFLKDNKATPKVQNMIAKVYAFADSMRISKAGDSNKIKDRINRIFDFSDKGGKSWLESQFYDQPMIAALTNLTKLESNVRTEEGNKVRDLLANKLEDDIELKAFVPIVSAPKYVRAGEKFDVIIAFGAYDNSLKGSVNLNGQNVGLKDGKAIVSMVATGSGKKPISGTITYDTPSGPETKPFKEDYEVVQDVVKELPTGGTVVADKMNVVYRGIDNPMSGSVTGVDASTISLNASSGTLTKNGKGWLFKPGLGNSTVDFTIQGKTSTGKVVSTKVTFRVKNVPKAQGQIRGTNVLSLPASSIENQTVSAGIPDFEFPVSFTVTAFKLKVSGQPTGVFNGNSLRVASGLLSKAKKGDQVLIFDIQATATGVSQQNISPIVINVQ